MEPYGHDPPLLLIVIVSVPGELVPAPLVAVRVIVTVPGVVMSVTALDVVVTAPPLETAKSDVEAPSPLTAVMAQPVGLFVAVIVFTAPAVSGNVSVAVPLVMTGGEGTVIGPIAADMYQFCVMPCPEALYAVICDPMYLPAFEACTT